MMNKIIFAVILILGCVLNTDAHSHHHSHSEANCGKPRDPHKGDGGAANDGVETKTLDQLYADAKKEGCKTIVYSGGDTPGQQDYYKDLFEKRFKGCTLDIIVDYSKYHDARINMQFENKRLIPDVVQLQTLQDFPIWKKQGRLMRYKPRGWNSIIPEYKDTEGYFVGIYIFFFTNCVNKNLMKDPATWPRDIKDYLKPSLKGHITLTYPNDDDAVLYLFKKFADKYGWSFLQELYEKQNVTWVRGSQEPSDALDAGRTWAAPAAGCDMHNPESAPSVFVLPKTDPFVAWPQTAAIFKDAKNPATGKLYLNWILDLETHKNNLAGWSTRSDVPPIKPFGPLSAYKNQTDPLDFAKFMADRAQVEELKTKVMLIIGEPQGPPSPGFLGPYPTKALPH